MRRATWRASLRRSLPRRTHTRMSLALVSERRGSAPHLVSCAGVLVGGGRTPLNCTREEPFTIKASDHGCLIEINCRLGIIYAAVLII